jgi:hypothetical protein
MEEGAFERRWPRFPILRRRGLSRAGGEYHPKKQEKDTPFKGESVHGLKLFRFTSADPHGFEAEQRA